MLSSSAVALALVIAAQAPSPPRADNMSAFAAEERASFLSLSLDAALDLPTAGLWPMASGRLDLRYRLPLGAAVVGEAGLRSGYGYRAFKGTGRDARYGEDPAAYLRAHMVPVYGIAALALGTGDESPLLVIPLRLSAYGGLGAHIAFGEAHGFGRTASLLAAAPSALVGGSVELMQTAQLRYGLFAEWEMCRFAHGVPGAPEDLSAARVGLTASYAFGL